MHKLFIQTSLFLIAATHCSVSFAMRPFHGQPIPRFTTNQLVALNMNPIESFNFSALPSELQICTAAFAHPNSMNNLSTTCKSLHNQLSFQTPQVWNIVKHSLNCISQENMPALFLKAHICEKTEIKDKISTSCETYTFSYNYYAGGLSWHCFFPLWNEEKTRELASEAFGNNNPSSMIDFNATPLMSASYTDDIHLVTNAINNGQLTNSEIERSLLIAITHERTRVIPLLCYQLKKKFNAVNKPDGRSFIDTASSINKINAFEALIIFYKDYLNEPHKDQHSYLDSLVGVSNEPAYRDIVIKHGGKSLKTSGLFEQCIVQ
jgi:hypothetical protein